MTQDSFRNATKNPAAYARPPMGGYDHQVGAHLFTFFNDFIGGTGSRDYIMGYVEAFLS
jgi:hypothetical protein